MACTGRECGAGSGMPLPYNGGCGRRECTEICEYPWRSLSAATDTIGTHHFNGGLYELQMPSRDCTPRALPRASRSGRHVGLRPPRNDNSGGHTIFTMACTGRECGAEPGCPFPCNDHTVRSASVTGTTLCRTASVVSICRPTRPPLKQTVSPSAIVASANVGNCFFMPMGLQPPWI